MLGLAPRRESRHDGLASAILSSNQEEHLPRHVPFARLIRTGGKDLIERARVRFRELKGAASTGKPAPRQKTNETPQTHIGLKLTPPEGSIPRSTFELLVKSLAYTSCAGRLTTNGKVDDRELRAMATLLKRLVPEEENLNALETWALERLRPDGPA